jgi:hypothetical protein
MARLARWLVLAISGLGLAASANARDNPGFREVWLLSIEVLAAPDRNAYSEPFAFELPNKTIELIWRIDGAGAAGITFSVAKDGVVVAPGLTNGASSRVMRGGGYGIVGVGGAGGAFSLQVFASVIDRSRAADS